MLSQISILVANVNQLLALGFTDIEIWKSSDLANSWQPVTGRAATSGILVSYQARTTWTIGGYFLRISVDGEEVSVAFDSLTKYWTPAMVAAKINESYAGLATADAVAGIVRLTAPLSGRGHYVEVLTSPMGLFDAGVRAYGLDLNLELEAGNVFYPYVDLAGAAVTDLYRWRYSAHGNSPVSEFSKRVYATKAPEDPTKMSIGYMSFTGLDGRPTKGRLIVAASGAAIVGQVARYAPLSIMVEADENGLLQVPLMRGSKVTIALEGTSFVREITVPDTSSFDLLAALSGARDELTVQMVPPLLTRRSL